MIIKLQSFKSSVYFTNYILRRICMGNFMMKIKSKALLLGVILNFLVTSCAFGDIFTDAYNFMRGGSSSSGTVAKVVSAAGTAWGLVWGVNASSNVYFREGVSQDNPQGTSWTLVDGDISYIAVGPTGQVYGWNRGGY